MKNREQNAKKLINIHKVSETLPRTDNLKAGILDIFRHAGRVGLDITEHCHKVRLAHERAPTGVHGHLGQELGLGEWGGRCRTCGSGLGI